MSDDWKPGDLAVCVAQEETAPQLLEVGRIYEVVDINADWPPGVGLVLAGRSAGDEYDGFDEELFRKIRPDAHEACEDEFVALLKRSKVTA